MKTIASLNRGKNAFVKCFSNLTPESLANRKQKMKTGKLLRAVESECKQRWREREQAKVLGILFQKYGTFKGKLIWKKSIIVNRKSISRITQRAIPGENRSLLHMEWGLSQFH